MGESNLKTGAQRGINCHQLMPFLDSNVGNSVTQTNCTYNLKITNNWMN